jgi:hypothetical protein
MQSTAVTGHIILRHDQSFLKLADDLGRYANFQLDPHIALQVDEALAAEFAVKKVLDRLSAMTTLPEMEALLAEITSYRNRLRLLGVHVYFLAGDLRDKVKRAVTEAYWSIGEVRRRIGKDTRTYSSK